MALGGGIAAALVIATLPHVYLENVVGATGLSEIIPAAAPPLGNTARGLIAVVAGLVSASAIYLFLNHKPKFLGGGSDMGLAIRNNQTNETMHDDGAAKSRFAVPRLNLSTKSLTKFLKKPKKSPGQVRELKDLPDVRPADRHPDAPTRQPIFASSDLGAPLAENIKRFDKAEPSQDAAKPTSHLAPETVKPAPIKAEPEPMPKAEKVEKPEGATPVPPAASSPPPLEDLSELTIGQLVDRLESGLRRLEALEKRGQSAPAAEKPESASEEEPAIAKPEVAEAPAPVAIPPLRPVEEPEADVQDKRQADMDAALKAALGTLEKMTAHR